MLKCSWRVFQHTCRIHRSRSYVMNAKSIKLKNVRYEKKVSEKTWKMEMVVMLWHLEEELIIGWVFMLNSFKSSSISSAKQTFNAPCWMLSLPCFFYHLIWILCSMGLILNTREGAIKQNSWETCSELSRVCLSHACSIMSKWFLKLEA